VKRGLAVAVLGSTFTVLLGAPALGTDYYGTEDPDTFEGTNNSDTFHTYGGNDYVQARGGFDEAYMAAGNDTARGEGGFDYIVGGASGTGVCCYDVLRGGVGDDSLLDDQSGDDKEYLCGGEDADNLWANDDDKHDWLTGGLGNDSLHYDNNELHVNQGEETCPP
jgi:Ca2+-binding RTX toxin-like protein